MQLKIESRYNRKRIKYLEKFENYTYGSNYKSLLNSVVIQRYLNKPLLWDKYYKFDIRVLTLLATTNPCILFYKLGKVRICAAKFEEFKLQNPMDHDRSDDEKEMNYIEDKTELSKHISNSSLSRVNEEFDAETSTINGRKTLADYDGFVKFMYDMAVNKQRFDLEWFELDKYKQLYLNNTLTIDDIEKIIDMKFNKTLSAIYNAAKDRFDDDAVKYNRDCQFVYHGVDIMLDEYGKMWVIEVNQLPALFKDHDVDMRKHNKNLLKESVDIAMEIRDLKLNGFKVDQYTTLKSQKIWNRGCLDYEYKPIDIVDNLINNINIFLNR